MNDNQSPWGGNSGNSGNNGNNKNNNGNNPPDLDEAINELKDKFSAFFNKGGNNDNGSNNSNNTSNAEVVDDNNNPIGAPKFKFVFILAFIVWLGSGFYIIDPAERGAVLRFGSFVESVGAGPHWHLPYPVERVNVVNVSEVRIAEIGFRTTEGNNGQKFSRSVPAESIMLTSDGNIVDASFEVQYRINDIAHYLFNVENPERTLEQVANSAIREVVGKHKIDYIITEGRASIASEVKEKSQKLLDFYKVGLHINTINFKSAQAPAQVQAAYSDVTKAKTDKQRYINQAESYANDILPKARGKSARMLEEANAYKSQIVSKAEGEASRFNQILIEYTRSKEVTKERLYRETMEEVLGNTSKIITSGDNGSLMYLPVDKLMENTRKQQEQETTTSESNQTSGGDSNIRNAFRINGGK
jgi:membrane protease subunit HflK